jgi:hypothetical protein
VVEIYARGLESKSAGNTSALDYDGEQVGPIRRCGSRVLLIRYCLCRAILCFMLETSVQFVCILIINQTCNCVKIVYGVLSLATPTLITEIPKDERG